MPPTAMVTNWMVWRIRLTTAPADGGDKIKWNPRNSGGWPGGVSQGGKRTARISSATMI